MSQRISRIDYNNARLMHGEKPTPAVLNRPLLACMDADNRLEESVQYIARSMSMAANEKTRFLSHCKDDGVDVIGKIAPTVGAKLDELFIDDEKFWGSALVRPAYENIAETRANIDTSMRTLTGWTLSTLPSGYSILFSDSGITVSNTDAKLPLTPAVASITSAPIPVNAGEVLSVGMMVKTDANMVYKDCEARIKVTTLDATGAVAPYEIGSKVKWNKYHGRVHADGIDYGTLVVPSTAVSAVVTLEVAYFLDSSAAAISIKNVMLEVSPVSHVWVPKVNGATSLKYLHAINVKDDGLNLSRMFSTVFWTRYNSKQASMCSGDIGPLFVIEDSGSINFGVTHSKNETANSLRAKLVLNGVVTYGNIIMVPPDTDDKYMVVVLRVGDFDDGTGTGVIVTKFEAAFVDQDLNVYKSTVTVPKVAFDEHFNIVVGTDESTTDTYGMPVTEIRYDTEWVNDYQLTAIALAQRAFSLEDEQYIGMDDLKEYLDGIGINLVKNPDGRLGLYHWKSFEAGKFNNIVSDPEIGDGFVWNGVATVANEIAGDDIVVTPDKKYTLRTEMRTDATATGNFGIMVRFYDALGAQVGTDLTSICMNNTELKYYIITGNAPAGSAIARVYMTVSNGASASRATWSRIKFERGSEGTMFTDEYSPKHALLAP